MDKKLSNDKMRKLGALANPTSTTPEKEGALMSALVERRDHDDVQLIGLDGTDTAVYNLALWPSTCLWAAILAIENSMKLPEEPTPKGSDKWCEWAIKTLQRREKIADALQTLVDDLGADMDIVETLRVEVGVDMLDRRGSSLKTNRLGDMF